MRSFVVAVVVCVFVVASGVRSEALQFSAGPSITVGTRPEAMAVGDLNRDGAPDVVVANNGSSGATALLGDGAGALQVSATVTVVSHPVAVALGDVNGDLNLDVATVGSANGNVVFRLGDGRGDFPTTSTYQT